MARGGLSHLALTASDMARSIEFVRGFMGYERGEVPESTQQAMKTQLVAWGSPNGSVTLRPAKSTPIVAHDRSQPGLNHIAFSAEDRADVELHTILKKIGVQILDPPAEYPYFPGYYAVYFTDPDGIKIEFVFWPQS